MAFGGIHALAWYGGNSGLEIGVENPYNTRSWPAVQFPITKAGSHRVKRRLQNPFGLYDMIGNVWEWCRDVWDAGAYAKRQPRVEDPLATGDDGGARVMRGGSWSAQARYCRAASRSRSTPASRAGSIGLRLSAGQELQPRGGGAAEGAERSTGEAEPGPEGPGVWPFLTSRGATRRG